MVPNQLKFVNPEAVDLHIALGISEERSNQLADMLTEMSRNLPNKHLLYDTIKYIEEICQTDEEFTWCIICHTIWLSRNGFL